MYGLIDDEVDPETLSDNFVSLGKRWIKNDKNVGAADIFKDITGPIKLNFYDYLFAFKNIEFKLRHTDYVWNGLKIEYLSDDRKFTVTAYNTDTHDSFDLYWCNYGDNMYYTTHGNFPDGLLADLIEFKDNINTKYIAKYSNSKGKFVYSENNYTELLAMLDDLCHTSNPHPNYD